MFYNTLDPVEIRILKIVLPGSIQVLTISYILLITY